MPEVGATHSQFTELTTNSGGTGKSGRGHWLDEWMNVEKGPLVGAVTTPLSIMMTAPGTN